MNRAHQQADRTLAVLSDHYFGSDFTLAEWSARFAQDPAAREDRLVPVKVGPLTDEGILAPIIYADLTDCDEAEAQRRLLERVKMALDASYRPKPLTRPGFPGSPAREVPTKPQFPSVQTLLQGGAAMLETIVTALVGGVAAIGGGVASEAGKDAYKALKDLLERKLGPDSKAVRAVTDLEEEPESDG